MTRWGTRLCMFWEGTVSVVFDLELVIWGSSGGHPGVIEGSSGGHRGVIKGSSGDHLGIIWGSSAGSSGDNLEGSSWDHLRVIWTYFYQSNIQSIKLNG